MSKQSTVALFSRAYDPKAYNPNAFNQLTYSRVEKQKELIYFAKPPESGHSTLEEILAGNGLAEKAAVGNEAALSLGAAFTEAAAEKKAPGGAAMAVAFLDTNMPMAAMFNLATGAWTSAQAQAAVASTDHASVFRLLESIPGQEAAGVVVESAGGLHLALRKVSALSKTALVHSDVVCRSMRVVEQKAKSVSSTEIFDAAVTSARSKHLVVTPFIGLKASQREICCDAIVVNDKIAFSAFSEKKRVDPTPPYWDRRIATLDDRLGGVESKVKAVLEQVIAKLGIKHAVIHSELALTDQGPLLSEFTARPGGGFIPEMVQAKFGVDLRAAHVYASFSMTRDLARIAKRGKDSGAGVAIAALYGDGDRPLSGLQSELSSQKDVVAYSVVNEISNSVVGATDLRAALCVRGKNAKAALQRLEEIAGKHGMS